MKALVRWITQPGVALVVFEVTGVYHQLVEGCIAKLGIPFLMANPRQLWRSAEGTGALVKTDLVKAYMLAGVVFFQS